MAVRKTFKKTDTVGQIGSKTDIQKVGFSRTNWQIFKKTDIVGQIGSKTDIQKVGFSRTNLE